MPTERNPGWRDALDELVSELQALYGSRLSHVVLYGSRARGEAEHDSDVDVLVVLEPLVDLWQELSRIQPLANRLSIQHDVVLSVIPVDSAEYAHPDTPLLLNSHRQGVVLT